MSDDDRAPTTRETGLGAAVLQAVDKAVVARWERAQRVAAQTTGTHDERIAALRTRFVREASGAGAARLADEAGAERGDAFVVGAGGLGRHALGAFPAGDDGLVDRLQHGGAESGLPRRGGSVVVAHPTSLPGLRLN